MKLPYGQEILIQEVAKANPNTIVVIIAGSPLELSGIVNRVPSILWAWYGGMEAGNAVADVLGGKVNPSGKMPFTLPVSLEQSPDHALGNYPGHDLRVNYEEDILVGYRWFDTKKIAPQFPFGYGLSYTTFELSGLNTNKPLYHKDEIIHVKFMVRNTGTTFGAEVAQIYVSEPVCSVLRPFKELKGFEKVFLQPGESKTVELQVNISDLAYYNEAQKGWKIEPGDFLVHLGTSSGNINQTVKIVVN